ncbi:hypothetical protein Q5752_000097 [Cryptotrichosporon argae]
MLALLALALPFLGAVNAVLSITYPVSTTTWYTNNTVLVNWTSSDPAADTFLFSVELSNSAGLLASNQSLAQSINATEDFVKILLPSLTSGSGYVVSLLNATTSAVLASSESFSIDKGATPSSTTSSTAASSTSAAASDIPNAVSTSAVVFPSAGASSSAAASASSTAKTSGARASRAVRAVHALGIIGAVLVGAVVA